MRKLSPGEVFRSKAHRRVEDILYEMNINFDSEVEFYPYRVDIYLPEWHFVVEVDGPLHSPKKDLIRDQTLEISYHLRVLHIPTGKNKPEIISLITQAAEAWAESADERKHA